MRKTVFMKLALVLAGAFLFATVSHAQSFTTVTATVTDSNGIPYAGGSMSATLVPGTPGGWTLNGQPYNGQIGPVTLDSTGTFIANFGSNAVILPASTQWKITVGSNPGGIPPPLGTGAQTFSVTMTISGSTQNISGTLNAAAPKLTNFTGGGGGSGTVTTIATTGPITGGPITTTGTIACPTCVTASGGGSVTIAANQIGFGSGTNTVIGSSNFTYSNPGGSCGLTAVAALTQCGDGAGSFNSQAALNENIVHGNGTQWNQVYSNSDGTGNTATTRETFLSMQLGNATFGDEFNMEMTTNGHVDAGIEFGGSRIGRPSGVSGGLNFDGNGEVELGIDNSDLTQTEWRVIPNGDMQLLTETGKNLCFEGTSTGEACVGVAAVAGTPNPMHWPTTTATAGQVLSSNGANPQQLVWITPSGGGSVSNQVLRGISANSSGTPTVVDSVVCTPPATNGAFTVGYTVAASVAVAPTCPQVGVASASISGATATYTVGTSVPNDASGIPIVHDIAGSSAVAVTLPTPTTLANTNAVVTYENRSAFTDTITPTTWTIQSGRSPATSIVSVPPGNRAQMTVDPNNATNWLAVVIPITNPLNSPGSAVDATILINTALASGGAVYLSPGTYAIKTASTPLSLSASNTALICYPGAIIQAQSGFSASFAMLDVATGTSNTNVSGCTFDGNSIVQKAISVDGSAANVILDHNEIKNTTLYGAVGNLRTSGPLRFTNNYVHNLGSAAVGIYDLKGTTGTVDLYVDNNRFDTLTGQGAGASGDSFFEASGNKFTNINIGEGSLYAYGIDSVNWQKNFFNNDGVAIHCDTCGSGTISFNVSNYSTSGAMADYFVEASANTTVEGNVSNYDSGDSGMAIGSGSSVIGPVQYRVQVLSFDNTTGYTPGTNVTLSTNSSTPKVGAGAMIATANSSFTTGTLWYNNFSSPNLFVGGYQEIWIQPTSSGFLSGVMSLVCSVNTNISTQDMVVPIPTQVANTWGRVVVYQPGWQGDLGQNAGGTGFKSCGVVINTSSPSLVVQFDEFDYASEIIGMKVVNNSIVAPHFVGVQLGAGQNTLVQGNYVENAGVEFGSQPAFLFQNSPNTQFTNNTANFAVGAFQGTGLTTVDTQAQSTTVSTGFTTVNQTTVYTTPADITGTNTFGVVTLGETCGGCYSTLATALAALPSTGGTIYVAPNYTETMAASIVLTKPMTTIAFLGPATINMGSNTITTASEAFPSISNFAIFGPSRGDNNASSTGMPRFVYTGTGTAIDIGTATEDTYNGRLDNFAIDITGAGTAAKALVLQEVHQFTMQGLTVLGSTSTGTTQMCIDSNGAGSSSNFSSYQDFLDITVAGCHTGVLIEGANNVGNNANNFIGGNVQPASDGTALYIADGGQNNTFNFDVHNAAIGVRFGANALRNDFQNLRIESNTADVQFDASSTYNTVRTSNKPIITDNGASFTNWSTSVQDKPTRLTAYNTTTASSGNIQVNLQPYGNTAPAGLYRLCVDFEVTTVATGGTYGIQFLYTDDAQAETYQAVATGQSFLTLGSVQACAMIRTTGSVNVAYKVAVTGITGTPSYTAYATLESLNNP